MKIKYVSANQMDWCVIYANNGDKIWEGHDADSNAVIALAKYFNHGIDFYDFTDENEIDGETPDNFNLIKGIKKL